MLYDDVSSGSFPLTPGLSATYVRTMWLPDWYANFPLGPRVGGFLVLVAIGWAVQFYFQDVFVSSVAGYFLYKSRRRASNKFISGGTASLDSAT